MVATATFLSKKNHADQCVHLILLNTILLSKIKTIWFQKFQQKKQCIYEKIIIILEKQKVLILFLKSIICFPMNFASKKRVYN